MKILKPRLFPLILIALLLSACSPHPGSGVWGAVADNEQGISKLTVGYEGRAEFVSSKKENTVWHCFWTALNKNELSLDCSPSTSEQKTTFVLHVNDQGTAELQQGETVLASFSRLDENPSPKK